MHRWMDGWMDGQKKGVGDSGPGSRCKMETHPPVLGLIHASNTNIAKLGFALAPCDIGQCLPMVPFGATAIKILSVQQFQRRSIVSRISQCSCG